MRFIAFVVCVLGASVGYAGYSHANDSRFIPRSDGEQTQVRIVGSNRDGVQTLPYGSFIPISEDSDLSELRITTDKGLDGGKGEPLTLRFKDNKLVGVFDRNKKPVRLQRLTKKSKGHY